MCSLSKYVVIGGFTGMAAATVTGSDPVGWLVAAVAVGATIAAGRLLPARFAPSGCALDPGERDDRLVTRLPEDDTANDTVSTR